MLCLPHLKQPLSWQMKIEELISKLEQIEEQATLTLVEYPHGLTVERQRLVVALAKQLLSHLKDQLREAPRVAVHSVDLGEVAGR